MNPLVEKPVYAENSSLLDKFQRLQHLHRDIEKRDISTSTLLKINEAVDRLNAYEGSASDHKTLVKITFSKLEKVAHKELRLRKPGHYLSIGGSIGLIMGTTISLFSSTPYGAASLICIVAGSIIGHLMDRKLKARGLQLEKFS